MNAPRRGISDEQARALWQRAAELQEAAEREPRALTAPVPDDGLTLEQIAVAAAGAGIDPDYVRVALAEQQLDDADQLDRTNWKARWLRAVLRVTDAMDVTHAIAASPEHVLAALKATVSKPAFEMASEGMLGENPLQDGILIYRLAGASSFHKSLDLADARVLLFTLRQDGDQTRVRIRVPLYRRGINLGLTTGTAALGAWGGFAGGTAVSSIIAGVVGVTALPVIAGAGIGALLGVGVYRGGYRLVYRGGLTAIRRLLQAITAEANG
jgi:hypothetical protein